MRNLILTMAEHQEQRRTASKARNNGKQMNPHKTSFHVSIHELRWRWMKSNKYPMELKTTTKQDFHMMHSETKSRAVSLSNHSKENEEDSSQTWITKLSTKSGNSQKISRKKKLYSNGEEQSIHGSHTFSFPCKLLTTRSFSVLLACFLPQANESPPKNI